MQARHVDVVCPKCRHKFQLPLGEALTPLIDGEIQRRLDEQMQDIIQKTRETAAKDSDQRNQTAVSMRDRVIADMRQQIDELRRKADVGSQQLQGATLELALETTLKTAFPTDRVTAVHTGGDAIHEVVGLSGTPVGLILWEFKNTKSWSREWLSVAKRDMRAQNAVLCVIATATLPKGVELFDRIDGVFVVSVRCVVPLAQVLRQLLMDIAAIRASVKQADGVAELLHAYMIGQQFHERISAILEGCMALQGDLDTDKRATSRRWARSQKHIDMVAQNMGAMFGDLQGLLGGTLRKLPGLTLNGDAAAGERAS
ncbi:MAG TPA: DUF2130 domain-containing protein [Candidatus Polarisedimenticolia bacterium]|nr:DUF2130 domain-containing protein [Candidatus Polarisedimenticolia bacterium]